MDKNRKTAYSTLLEIERNQDVYKRQHKNYPLISAIGKEMAEKYDVEFLDLDFKKKAGFQRSIMLSKEYGLYRQNYCGCQFSKR